MFQALVFSNSGDDTEVQKAAKEMFDKFVEGDDKAVNINIQGAVFGIALEHGGEKEVCLPFLHVFLLCQSQLILEILVRSNLQSHREAIQRRQARKLSRLPREHAIPVPPHTHPRVLPHSRNRRASRNPSHHPLIHET